MAAQTRTGPEHLLSRSIGFMPEAMRTFLRRRLQEGLGLILALAGCALALALSSYDSLDPSWNNAAGGPASNLTGRHGALAADAALQWIGLATLVPIAILVAWGIRLLIHRALRTPVRRVFAVLIATGLFAIALAGAPVAPGWPLRSGLGGVVGDIAWAPFDAGVAAATGLVGLDATYATPLALALVALMALICLFYALSMRPAEWRALARHTATGSSTSLRRAGRAAQLGAGVAGRLTQACAMSLRNTLADRRSRREPIFGAGRGTPVPNDAGRPDDDDDDVPESRAPLAARDKGGDRETGGGAADTSRRSVRIEAAPKQPKPGRRAEAARQATLDLPMPGDYEFPSLDLLSEPAPAAHSAGVDEEALEQNARMLESVLDDFGVRGEIVKVRPGPVVTLYELEPAPGTKTSRVIGLADDIARSMSAISVRIAVVPGRNVIGIELPNARRETVHLRELLASAAFEKSGKGLMLALGKDIGGEPVTVDLARMPHLLIAGTTGSGKSVGINSMIASLLYRLRPEDCRMIMIDPKMLELSVYDGIPHLLAPVVTDPKKAVVALKWVVREMETRYRNMSKLGVRNIAGYNQRLEQARKKGEILSRRVQTGFDEETGKPVFEEQPLDTTALPYIVVVVDEMADLMLVAGKDVEAAIQRLAQMARAAGIHLVLATQRPSVDVITGTIKANLPTRISFQVTTKIDSRTILGEQGAEQLLGQGDMLYMAGGGRITRVHGPFLADSEVEDIVAFLKSQGAPDYLDDVTEDEGAADGIPGFEMSGEGGGSGDDLYDQAVALVARERKASTSFVQRHLQIGYNRAARIIEQMEKEGVVSTANHVGKREVLVGDHSGN
jgi:S-DNA-T family DNA segregation ATPase FtsK/SpoIIIE